MSAVEDVMVKCTACAERVAVKPRMCLRADNAEDGLTLKVVVPKGWRLSYGASGSGCYVTCPACTKKGVSFDDTTRGKLYIDYRGDK